MLPAHGQVVTWGQPCCFERTRRRPGSRDANRAWFAPALDLCADQWLILHKIEHVQEMWYLGQRLRQCGRVQALKDSARALAVASRDTSPPLLHHGEVGF